MEKTLFKPAPAMASKFDGPARAVVLLCLLLLAAGGTYYAIGLYADGSSFLYCVLDKRGYCLWDKPRAYAGVVAQTPLVAALKLGVADVNALIRLHSAGLVIISLGLWAAALALHLKSAYFWLLTAGFAAIYLNAGFFAVGEYNLTFAIVALCVAILIRPAPLPVAGGVALLAMGTVLLRAYEAVALFGILLGAMSLVRLYCDWRSPGARAGKFLLAAAAALFFIDAVVALYYIAAPVDPLRDTESLLSLANLRNALNRQFAFTLMMLIPFGAMLLPSLRRWRRSFIVVALVIAVVFLATPSLWAQPQMYYAVRVPLFAVAACLLMLPFLAYLLDRRAAALCGQDGDEAFVLRLAPGGHAVALALTVMLCIPFVMHQRNFFLWLTAFEKTVNAGSGLVAQEQVPLAKNPLNRLYGWAWAYPMMSLVIRRNGDAMILLNAADYQGWVPFDPREDNGSFMRRYVKKPF